MARRPGSTYAGTKRLSDGGTYRGEMVDGKAHGQGTCTWPNEFRTRYEGEFCNDKRHGKGTFTWADGDKYEGEFCDDKMHGQGTYTWPDGRRYEGGWCDDKKHGQGTYTWPEGSRYEGAWSVDEMHGHGTFTDAAGWSYTGDLVHGRPTQGVLTEAGGRRFAVTYRKKCKHICDGPTPLTKQEVGAGAGAGGGGCAAVAAGGGSSSAMVASGGGGAGGTETPETVPSGSKRKSVYASLLSPVAKAARIGGAGGSGGAGGGARSEWPKYDLNEVQQKEVQQHVNVLYRWEWRSDDGTYEAFDEGQCIKIETAYRTGLGLTSVWGRLFPVGGNEELKCIVDFEDMTASVVG
jgi:hypothetical protein